MTVPESRCDFVLDRGSDTSSDDSVVYCGLESWKLTDANRCVWHAKVEGKSAADLPDRSAWPERLDGAYLRLAVLRDEVDFSNCTLRRVNFGRADLRGADFEDADLSGTILRRADLSGANLDETDLSGAYLRRADLSEAVLDGANLSGAILRRATLSGAILDGTYSSSRTAPGTGLSPPDFSRTDLSGAVLDKVELPRANFQRAKLPQADLSKSEFLGADFTRADLSGATLEEVDLSNAELQRATLSSATLEAATLSGANLKRADISDADFTRSKLNNARFRYVVASPGSAPTFYAAKHVRRAVFDRADFSGAVLRNYSFTGASFRQVDFSGADLYQTRFDGADLTETVFDGADCRQVDLEGATLEDASFIECDLRSANLTDAKAYHAVFSDSRMNFSTTIDELFTYPPEQTETLSSSALGHVRREKRLAEQRAWSHQTIHHQLVTNGRLREALHEKHYRNEQRARLERARLELRHPSGETTRVGALLRLLNLRVSDELIRMSEEPLHVGRATLAVAVVFTLFYASVVSEFQQTNTILRNVPLLPDTITTVPKLFVFSLLTFLEGTYLVLRGTFDGFLPFDAFEPEGAVITVVSGVEATGLAASTAAVERFLGALLIIPFALLVVQRLRLYIGSPASSEGFGSGLLSWLLNK